MSVRFAPRAEADLEAIGDYIAADDRPRALAFVGEMRARCEEIASSPQSGRTHPELGDGIRSSAHGRYSIFFQSHGADVLIVRVLRD